MKSVVLTASRGIGPAGGVTVTITGGEVATDASSNTSGMGVRLYNASVGSTTGAIGSRLKADASATPLRPQRRRSSRHRRCMSCR